jgi:hemoglobin-like flavoprotein
MTPHQITLVRTTFSEILLIADPAAALLYARLFELDPSLRPMFTSDMELQGRKLLQVLAFVVHGLDKLEVLAPALRAIGRRHAEYGVTNEHYETVAAALLYALELGLGQAFTPDVRDAWTAAYGLLAETMQAGAAESLPRIA